MPEKETVINEKHDGITKGVLSLAFELLGYATTKVIIQEKKQKTITTVV